LEIDELFPKDLEKFPKTSTQKGLMVKNSELWELFDKNTIQINRMGRYARFNVMNEAKITIEYHCLLIPNVK
jgi:hypothetical protein